MLAYRHGFKSSSLPWQEDTVSLYLPFHSRHLRPVFLCFCYSVFLPDRFLFSLIPATLAFNFLSVSTVQPCCTVRCCFVFPLLFARRRPSVLAASLPFCSPPFPPFPFFQISPGFSGEGKCFVLQIQFLSRGLVHDVSFVICGAHASGNICKQTPLFVGLTLSSFFLLHFFLTRSMCYFGELAAVLLFCIVHPYPIRGPFMGLLL